MSICNEAGKKCFCLGLFLHWVLFFHFLPIDNLPYTLKTIVHWKVNIGCLRYSGLVRSNSSQTAVQQPRRQCANVVAALATFYLSIHSTCDAAQANAL